MVYSLAVMFNVTRHWNHRARLLGDSFSSVMEQSFPRVINHVIHSIHRREVLTALPAGAKRALDVGCGWGRIAKEIVKRRQIEVEGIDLSEHFVNLFNNHTKERGHAVVADMRKIPFATNSFDFVYCIVSLMYLSRVEDQKKGVSEMLRVTRRGGRLLLIEPNFWGVQIVRIGGLVPFVYRTLLGKPKVETGGVAFHLGNLRRIIEECGGRVIRTRGYPFLTLVLLPTIVVAKVSPALAHIFLSTATVFDRLFPIAFSSYFITWEIIKK